MAKIKDKKILHLVSDELRKDNIISKSIFVSFVLTAITLSLLLFFLFSKLSITGYAGYISSQAGSITELEITQTFPTHYWSGIYGLALRVPDFTEQLYNDFDSGYIARMDVFFECIEEDAEGGTEVYVSESPVIDFDNLEPATLAMVDSFLGCSGAYDCASNTFTETMSVLVGDVNITGIPSTHTFRYDGQNNVFDVGVLYDGEELVYVTHISNVQRSFNQEKIVNFQMLLPIPPNETRTYYFFTDPNDECPEGGGIGSNIEANVSGYVFDENGDPAANVSVMVAGYSTESDINGSYNISFTVIPGNYTLIARESGYKDFLSLLNVSFSNYAFQQNISLVLDSSNASEVVYPYVYGYVTSSSGSAVSNAKVMLGDASTYSGTSGFYSFYPYISVGNYSIIAIKTSYDNYYDFLTFESNTSIVNKNITLVPSTMDYDFPTGPYTDDGDDDSKYDQPPVEEVLEGEDYWVSTKDISVEVRENTFIEEEVGIYNFKNSAMDVTFTLSPELRDFVKLDKSAISIAPGAFGTLIITIYGIKPLGIYNGTLTIGGDLDLEIPINVVIVEKKFPVEVLLSEISLFENVVQPGDTLKYRLNLQNLLRDQSYKVKMNAHIRNVDNDTIYYSEDFESEVGSSLTLLKEITLPENISDGEFVLEVDSKYLNLASRTTAYFVISQPLYLYAFFGLPLWMIVAMISFLSFISLNFFLYKQHQAKKKRYKVSVDFGKLPQPGERVVKLGLVSETKHPAYYELEKLTTHAIVAGATGMGKSISAQVMIEEALMNDVAVIVFDPTAQWSGMLRKCDDKKMMSFYPKFGLKPTDARAFKGNVRYITNARQLININKYMNPGQIQIFTLNKLDPKDIDIFIANVIRQVFKSDPKESPNLKVLLVFDEVHRLLSKFGGSGEGFLQIERACREFRKWGLGVMLISQVLNDFVGEIKANINTEVQTRTLEESDLERIKMKYGESFLKSLVRAEVGVAMFQNAEYNLGRPYFINFRPILHSTRRLPDEELEKYNKYNDVVDDLEYQIEQLEAEKIDVFDLKMELKLVKDKIMSGNFSVVEIYLEGLTPRIEGEWGKLGKKPKKREVELVDEAEIKKSIEEAKKEREKIKTEENKDSKTSETKSSENKNEGSLPKTANTESLTNIGAKVPQTSDRASKDKVSKTSVVDEKLLEKAKEAVGEDLEKK